MSNLKKILIPVSAGELLDKISILQIKTEKIKDAHKKLEVNKELVELIKYAETQLEDYDNFIVELKEVNEKLWDVEDRLREKEKQEEWDERFIELARSVYLLNDQRFKIKDKVNQYYNSEIKEQKSYSEY